jgi:hypothetical protein
MQMLAVLERKERIVEAEINILDYQEANREPCCGGLECRRHMLACLLGPLANVATWRKLRKYCSLAHS